MKTLKRALVSALALLVVGMTFPACSKGSGVVNDPKTLNVKLFNGGFGTEWAYELKSKFEAAYKDEGYKVNIVRPSSDMRGIVPLQDLTLGYEKTKIDLYITGDVQAVQVGTNNAYKKGEALVEETEELVYNQKAIGYDGKEEEKTVAEKLSPVMLDWLKDSTSYDSDKVYYGVPYINPIAGLVVNTKKLAKYGYVDENGDTILPKTSDEIVQMFQDIYLGANGMKNSAKSNIYPFTFFPSNASAGGYGMAWLEAMIAQYDYEEYQQLLSFTADDGNGGRVNMKEDGYKVYGQKGFTNALELTYFFHDKVMSAKGSTTQTMVNAQSAMMKEDKGAVFMANGDWMLNEVKLSFKKNLNDIDFINFPVVSLIGEEEFGAGTTLNLSDADADKLLSYIIGLVDEEKEIAEIISTVKSEKGYDVTRESVERIAFARGLNYNRGIEHQCFITKGSTKKDMAARFLRMMASDDCSETIAKLANSTSAYASGINNDTTYGFVKSASAIPVNKYATAYRWFATGLRKGMGKQKLCLESGDVLSDIINKTNTMFTWEGTVIEGKDFSVYVNAAKDKAASEAKYVQDNWSEWLKTAEKNGF